jgi:thioredoxin reductase (NADPH)
LSATYDLIVVGEGIAGLTCAAEAARLGLKVATFEAEFFGGLVLNVNELHRFDEAGGLSGMDHAGTIAMGNKKAGVKSTQAAVRAVRPVDGGFEVDADGNVATARCVVLASGAHLRKLGVPGEEEFQGRGVSHCADCDAPMFAGGSVVVFGGGDWALQDAMVLARECSAVHVVHEGHAPTACAEYIDKASAEPTIRFHPDARAEAILGDSSGVTGVRLRDARGTTSEIACTGVFAVVGLQPNGDMAPAAVQRDAAGFLLVDEQLETGVPGLWAIGQVRHGFGGWLAEATQDARRAAQFVRARLA